MLPKYTRGKTVSGTCQYIPVGRLANAYAFPYNAQLYALIRKGYAADALTREVR
jgi:hypothetical protein